MKHYPRPFVSFHPNAVKIFFYNGVVTRLSSWKAIDRSLLPWHHNRPVPDSQDATVCKQHIFPRLFYALFVLWIFPLFVFILSCQWKTKIMLFRGLESKEFIVNSKNSKEKLCECSIHTASLLFRTELFTYFLANIDSIYCSICFAMSLSSHLATSFWPIFFQRLICRGVAFSFAPAIIENGNSSGERLFTSFSQTVSSWFGLLAKSALAILICPTNDFSFFNFRPTISYCIWSRSAAVVDVSRP